MTVPSPGKSRSLLRSRKRSARTPPSTFLFLPIHLSNSPGPKSRPPGHAGKPTKHEPPSLIGGHSSLSVRSFRDATSTRERTARRIESLYGLRPVSVNQKAKRFCIVVVPANPAFKLFFTHRLSTGAPHLSHIPPPFLRLLGKRRGAPLSVRQVRSVGLPRH
jgi:hypothetical protein